MYLTYSLLATFVTALHAFCTGDVRRHNFRLEDVQGMWFGVGHAQHIPDLTNKPNKVGCLSVYISDVTDEARDDWTGMDPSLYRRNWTDPDWRSPRSNPWSNTPMSGSWMDYRMKHVEKREISLGDRRLLVVWDEDGQTEEQSYIYSQQRPNVWSLEQWDFEQSEVYAKGLANLDFWRPDDAPKRPEHIYILKATLEQLVLYHCAQGGGGRAFSLVLRRTPSPLASWDWYDIRKLIFTFQLPNVVRFSSVCDASDGARIGSGVCVLISAAILLIRFFVIY